MAIKPMDKQILIDRAVVGLPKLFNDMSFDSPLFRCKIIDFIMESFGNGNVEQFKFEVNQFTGESSDEAIFDAIQIHVDQCMAELKEMAIDYKLKLIIQRFQ